MALLGHNQFTNVNKDHRDIKVNFMYTMQNVISVDISYFC